MIMIAAIVQFNTYLSGDLGWHLNIAKGMLSGKQLYVDYFEVNTPLIIYITEISVFLSQIFNVNLILGLNIFNFSLSLTSFLICLQVIKRSESETVEFILPFFVAYAIFIIPLMFPVSEFGQKEHIFMLLFMPYILEFALKLKPQTWLFVLACVGMLIKPYFILAYLGIFIIRLIERDRTVLTECAILISINMLFLIWMLYVHSEYFDTIVPIALNSYKNLTLSDGTIKSNIANFYMISIWTLDLYVFAFIFSIITITKNTIRLLPTLLALLFSVYLQGKDFWYHYIPFFMVINLLFGLLFIEFKEGSNIKQLIRVVNVLLIFGCLSSSLGGLWSNYNNQNNKHIAQYEHTIKYLEKYKNKKILALSPDLGIVFPTALYFNLQWDMKQHSMQILDGLFKFKDKINTQDPSTKYVADDVVQALKLKPEVVLVLRPNKKIIEHKWNTAYFFKAGHNYIDFFSQYSDFKELWKLYKFREEISNGYTQFEVYEPMQ